VPERRHAAFRGFLGERRSRHNRRFGQMERRFLGCPIECHEDSRIGARRRDQAGEAPVFGALRGLERVHWWFTLAAAAYNLIRLPRLIGAPG
jgi:hypothetical protein